jgi:hydroxymethylglutaryl-CoA lyase
MRVEIVEVSPRDGLQNEPEIVSTAHKLDLIARARAAGFARIEVSSFVNPKKVPQMADAAEIHAGLPADAGTYVALALNLRGYERAVEAGAREVNYVLVATDEFSIRNNGAPTWDTLPGWAAVAERARADGVKATLVIGASFGCPFEGEVPVARVVEVAARACEAALPAELALADTIGVGSPFDVKVRFGAVASALPGVRLRAHFHNTRNTGLANAVAAIEAGVSILDGSLAGVGGCPFAPGAAGNVPSEDLIYMLHRMGVETGVNLDKAVETARFLSSVLGRPTPGGVSRAGVFPAKLEACGVAA